MAEAIPARCLPAVLGNPIKRPNSPPLLTQCPLPAQFVGPFTLPRFAAIVTAHLHSLITPSSSHRDAPSPVEAPFVCTSPPQISLHDYVLRLIFHMRCPPEAFVAALVLIDRTLSEPDFNICESSVHRVFLTAVVVATKVVDDTSFSATFYALAGGLPCRKEVIDMEWAFISMLNFRTFVGEKDYCHMLSRLRAVGWALSI